MKDVGKPCKREAYARIDGGRLETGRDHGRCERSRRGNPRGERPDLPSRHATAPVVYPPVVGDGGKSEFSQLKKTARRPSWSNFRTQLEHQRWAEELGDARAWWQDVPASKITDFFDVHLKQVHP